MTVTVPFLRPVTVICDKHYGHHRRFRVRLYLAVTTRGVTVTEARLPLHWHPSESGCLAARALAGHYQFLMMIRRRRSHDCSGSGFAKQQLPSNRLNATSSMARTAERSIEFVQCSAANRRAQYILLSDRQASLR